MAPKMKGMERLKKEADHSSLVDGVFNSLWLTGSSSGSVDGHVLSMTASNIKFYNWVSVTKDEPFERYEFS